MNEIGPEGVVVVGASLTGGTAVQTLRDEGYTGRIVLVGAEQHRPYERPPLSKGYLLGTAERDSVFLHAAGWYAEHDVDLRLGTRATALDLDEHEVELEGGERLPFACLLLATGSVPRPLDVPGTGLTGVHVLRTLDDSERLKAAIRRASRVVVVGGGWIGLETAAAARQAGLEVTVLEVADLPLLRVLGPETAQLFADLHLEHGVDLRVGTSVAELVSDDGHAVSGVRLSAPELAEIAPGVAASPGTAFETPVIPADLVVVGIGITPDVRLAAEAGLDVRDGVVVDEHLRTSHPDVLAAGDVALAYHPSLGRHLRVEHWENARRQGAQAARSILGLPHDEPRLPYFFSDQYDLGMEYVGFAPTSGPDAYDDVVLRGDVARRELVAFWCREGRVVAGMAVNVWDVIGDVEALIRSGRVVDPARLADPAVPLREV